MIIACDSNPFIYLFDEQSPFWQLSLGFFQAARSNAYDLVASELVIAEFLSYPEINDALVDTIKQDLINLPVRYERIDQNILIVAAKLRRGFTIKLPDAIHLASALQAGATHFITNDQKLLRKKIKGINLIPLTKAATLFT